MTEAPIDARNGAARWTCPFCALLCDDLRVGQRPDGGHLLTSGHCAAALLLATFDAGPPTTGPTVDGLPCSEDDAVARAAGTLAASLQPLFGGLGTDVDGARAIYRLAATTGAICDAVDGGAASEALRVLQDRGGYTTTLAEIRERADVVVWLGPTATATAIDFFARCAALPPDDGGGTATARHIVVVGSGPTRDAIGLGVTGVTVETIPLHDDAMTTVAILAALVAGRAVPDPPPALAALAARLRSARYAVVAAETAQLPAHGGLLIETCNRVVATLNLTTRAAALWIGAGNGGSTTNQVFTWLSGLPLRSRAGPYGLEHEPLAFDTTRLVASRAVDALLWVSSFDAGCSPPATELPLVVLGHPALAVSAARPNAVFIPVATPGIDCAGHLFRADGNTVLPLRPLRIGTLPLLAEVLGRIGSACQAADRRRSAR
jgi:formylmethanofuran dehydrogenase subunit B